jgi:hypothetical protein
MDAKIASQKHSKPVYEKPILRAHGSIESVTRGLEIPPAFLDNTFPTGTPFDQLTFSNTP